MGAPRKDYDRAVALYLEGHSVEAVARRHGITRQAMWRILARRGVSFRRINPLPTQARTENRSSRRGDIHPAQLGRATRPDHRRNKWNQHSIKSAVP
jgi:transposase-like protein